MRDIRNRVGSTLLQIPAVTIVNHDETGRILLVRHRDTDLWVVPGGAIEPGETPADSAVREMWEETGLIVELTGIVGVYGGGPEFVVQYSNGDRTSYVMTVFASRTIGGHLCPQDDETSELGYFALDAVVGLDVQSWVGRILPALSAGNSEAHFTPASWTPHESRRPD